MELKIKNFRIKTLDEMNIVLEEYRKVKNTKTGITEKEWCFIGYYTNLEYAINALIDERLNRADTKSLVDLQKVLHNLRLDVKMQVNKLLEYVEDRHGINKLLKVNS